MVDVIAIGIGVAACIATAVGDEGGDEDGELLDRCRFFFG